MSADRHPHPLLGAIEVRGMSRGAFLLRGALAAGAALGASSVGPWLARAQAQTKVGDAGILNFALTLEYLERDYYEKALDRTGLSGQTRDIALTLRKDEGEHVATLRSLVGQLASDPVAQPRFDFGDALRSESSFLKLAQELEDTGVSAYNGQGPKLVSKDLLAAAGRIVQTEGRHAGAIRFLRGVKIAPAAFDKGKTMDQVLEGADKYFVK